jgi:hypothetical protein
MEAELLRRCDRLEAEVLAAHLAIRALILLHERPRTAAALIADQIDSLAMVDDGSSRGSAFVDGAARALARMKPLPAQWRVLREGGRTG